MLFNLEQRSERAERLMRDALRPEVSTEQIPYATER